MRIFTSAGNIAAFANQLPRLKQLGVKILCLMPVTPISTTNHKGTQGSVFAVDDYRAINPTYGTATDFKNLITTAHNNGFKVMVDWNAASTGFDHPWTVSHPTWYKQDYNQNILAVSAKDSDLAALDYTNSDLRTAMIAEMNYWVTNYDVDGFRAVYASTVPMDFWNRATAELRQLKPLMFAADFSSAAASQYSFVTGYNPAVLNLANAAGKKKASKNAFVDALLSTQNNYASPAYGLNYITNNDVNATTGSEVKRVGASAKAMAALSFTAPGMPLIYSGQEIGLDKQLKIYDYDRITWPTTNATQTFYKKLVALKAKNVALSSGTYAGSLTILKTSSKSVAAFSRRSGDNIVITILNFGAKKTKATVTLGSDSGSFFDLMTGKKAKLAKKASVTLAANGFAVYSTVAAN
jgi:glycosidase